MKLTRHATWNHLVPDCPEYRNRRKPTIMQRCEKAKKLNIITTCEVVPRTKESRHNRHLRLSCARLKTVNVEKPKTYTTIWRTVNSWTTLWQKLATSGMDEYMCHFLMKFFHTIYCHFASRVILCFLASTFIFLLSLFVRSHSFLADRRLWLAIDPLLGPKNTAWVYKSVVSFEDISDQRNDQRARTAVSSHEMVPFRQVCDPWKAEDS